jgi:sugar-phosphatase
VWHRWAAARGRDPSPFLAVAHGRRISETLRLVAPELDWRRETTLLDQMEETETDGLVAAPTAAELLRGLPVAAWAIVTSGSVAVARLRLEATGLPIPPILVTAEDVEHGKPDPEGYRRGAARLGVPPEDCVVVEDAPPGVAAAKAAGMRVIAVLTTHLPERLSAADAHLAGLDGLRVTSHHGELRLELAPVAGTGDTTHTLPP